MSYLERRVCEYDAIIKKCMNDGIKAPQIVKDRFLNMSRQRMVRSFKWNITLIWYRL